MTSHSHDHSGHSHTASVELGPEAGAILERGLAALVEMTKGLEFRAVPSERNPAPLALSLYRSLPAPGEVRREVEERMASDPVSVLEQALVLLELHETNQPDISELILEDGPFLDACFGSKRLNGWIAVIGDSDRNELEEAVNGRWQFKFRSGPSRPTGIYVLLNMLARYAFVYGKIREGDFHAMGHFVEDFTPGLVVVRGAASDLELLLSLAAMRMGVPAIVPKDYPFELGRHVRADSLEEITESVTAFPNIRRLLSLPEIPPLPSYCDEEHMTEKFEPATVWGDTPESFYILRKGKVEKPGEVKVTGEPHGPMGIIVTVDAEPLDPFDRRYIERQAAASLLMISGVMMAYDGARLAVKLREGTALPPERIGEVLIAAIRHEHPKIQRIGVEIVFDEKALFGMKPNVESEKKERAREIEGATEENVDLFYSCVGCSPFCPDHVCIVTPERHPQCGRPFEQIKTGALYGYDDMSNIHHATLQQSINSFGAFDKRRCLDAERGEWEGANETAAKLSGGRTTRIQLHSLDESPTTGCGCFRLVMFKTEKPRAGIGVMDAGYEGHAPDGRSWRDLHYCLAGKQTKGVSGAPPAYVFSKKFLKHHGGWDAVVWVTPKVAALMGNNLPKHVEVG